MVKCCSRVRSILPIVLFFVVISSGSSVLSRELIVCTNPTASNEYRYYELALAAANSGDTITVRRSASDPNPMNLPTTNPSFQGNLNFGGKMITLLNADDDPTTVIIQGNNTSNSTIYIDTNQVNGSVIKGFTIIGARGTSNGNGGAMSIHRSIKIENCIIRDSSAQNGGGVRVTNAAKPVFKRCLFSNNAATDGGAVYVDDTGDGAGYPSFSDCMFINNNRCSGDGEVAHLSASPASFINCTIAGNQTGDTIIYQDGSFLPLTLVNCIVDASGNGAVITHNSTLGWTEGASQFYIINSYINGSYACTSGVFNTNKDLVNISYVYEPNRIQVSPGAFVTYTGYLPTSSFNLNFINTGSLDYHLRMDSSAIGFGINQGTDDFDDETRPYFLGNGTDLGADQFNFCYLVDHGLYPGSQWYDSSVGSSETVIGNNLSTTRYYQTGKVRFFRIIPTVSGLLRIRSDASVDVKAILATDCEGYEILATDDDSGSGTNFTMDYIYAQKGIPYYLGVINKTTSTGSLTVYAQIITDDYPNSCEIAESEGTVSTFTRTYFETGYADLSIPSGGITDPGTIDFASDEDVFELEFDNGGTPVPGTVVITSKLTVDGEAFGQTTPEYLDVDLKDENCDVLAENSGAGSILIIYQNPTGQNCFLHVDRSRYDVSGVELDYAFNVRYYPLDETDPRQIVFSGNEGAESGAITVPGDTDRYYFEITQPGVITARTTGCASGEDAKINIYNPLNEKIVDNGYTESGTGNYIITYALSGEMSIPMFVSPGTYYLRVSALNGHTTPFEYGVTVNFTASADDHSDYRELGTILSPWKDVASTDPRLYFYPSQGHIGSASDVDFFRMDITSKTTVEIMADFALTTGVVNAKLLNYQGKALSEKTDIRMANPDFPMADPASIPNWASGTHYLVNTVIRYNSNYYRCTNETTGTVAPSSSSDWAAVSAPPSGAGGLVRGLEPGTYYIEISGASGIDYLVSVDIDDFGDNWTNAEPPKANNTFRSIQGHLETAANPAFPYSNDADAFQLEVHYPNQFRIYTTGTSNTYGIIKCISVPSCTEGDVYPGWSGYTDEDYDAAGNFVIGDFDPATYNDFGIPLVAGTYSVELALSVPTVSSPTTGDYVIHFEPRDDYCNKSACSEMPYVGVLTGGSGSRTGVIETAGDIDYFSFTPTQTGRLTLSKDEGSLNLVMCLMDEDDDRLTFSSSGNMAFDVTAGTDYFVLVKPEYALNTGPYELTYDVVTGASTDNDGAGGSTGNNFADAATLTFSGSTASYTTGGVDLAGDHDFYKFQVTGPCIVNIYTTGDTDTYGYLFLETNNMFNLVMSNDDSEYNTTDGRNFGMYYYLSESGVQTMYVKVSGYSTNETGDYQLYITYSSGQDDHGDDCGTATLVNRNATGASWTGDQILFDESRIGISGDTDFFKCVAGPEGTDKGTLTVYTSDGNDPFDSFGYLKNLMCGTIAMNDNGSGGSDGMNFRITYEPDDCEIGASSDCTPGEDCECGPRIYHVLVRSYNGTETGTYDFHSQSNGAYVLPVSTTSMAITGNGTRYFGFEAPAHDATLTASVAGVSGFNVSPLRITLLFGDGTVVKDANDVDVENRTLPITVTGLDRGLHFIQINHTSSTSGDFNLSLTCE